MALTAMRVHNTFLTEGWNALLVSEVAPKPLIMS